MVNSSSGAGTGLGRGLGDGDDPPDGPVPGGQRIVDEGVVTQDAFDP